MKNYHDISVEYRALQRKTSYKRFLQAAKMYASEIVPNDTDYRFTTAYFDHVDVADNESGSPFDKFCDATRFEPVLICV